jgi:hypothetical protein
MNDQAPTKEQPAGSPTVVAARVVDSASPAGHLLGLSEIRAIATGESHGHKP